MKYIVWFGILILFYCMLRYFLPLDIIQQYATQWDALIHEWYYWLLLGYFVLYVGISILPLPGETGISLLASFLFGSAVGITCIVVGATVGALISFYIVRRFPTFFRSKAHLFIPIHEQLVVEDPLYLISLRLLPVIPFFVVNYAAGLSSVSIWTFAWTTMIGITPICSVYGAAGRELRTITSFSQIFSWKIMLTLLVLGIATMMPTLVKKYRSWRTNMTI